MTDHREMGGLSARMPVYAAVWFFVFARPACPPSGRREFLALVGTSGQPGRGRGRDLRRDPLGRLSALHVRADVFEGVGFLAGLGDPLTDMTATEVLTLVRSVRSWSRSASSRGCC
jgi:hypothetical protein